MMNFLPHFFLVCITCQYTVLNQVVFAHIYIYKNARIFFLVSLLEYINCTFFHLDWEIFLLKHLFLKIIHIYLKQFQKMHLIWVLSLFDLPFLILFLPHSCCTPSRRQMR